jgi:sugar phosphate isomerase/epimerase
MKRRSFLSTAAATLGAGLLPRSLGGVSSPVAPNPGIQLYTVRRLMAQDAASTLAALAQIGYREVELAGLYGKTAAEFRGLLNQNGLAAPAAHIGIGQLRTNLSKVLDDSTALGHRWIIVPSLSGDDRTPDGLKRVGEFLNQTAMTAKPRGFRLGYHNHQYEFPPLPTGERPFDILLQNTDPTLVDFELDLYHAREGGGNALEYFARFPGRFAALHVKDATPDGRMANVGQGVIDFAAIFAQADSAGVKHYFVEHDNPADPINDVRASFVALQKLLASKK